jgi:hypothetical protein
LFYFETAISRGRSIILAGVQLLGPVASKYSTMQAEEEGKEEDEEHEERKYEVSSLVH